MFITDKVITAGTYALCYSGQYFVHCDTYKECQMKLTSEHIYVPKGMPITKLTADDIAKKNLIIVQFSKEECFTDHDYLVMTVQKKYLKRFLKRLEEEYSV